MIWRNPWAWIGLLTLAVPLLVHMLARRQSRRKRFPTLRFLEATPPMATRRARLRDPLLMALRMMLLAVAVAALAQPYLVTEDRAERAGRAVTLAVVVDTSRSMERQTAEGERAVDVARRVAGEIEEEGASLSVIETAAPGEVLAGAVRWLEGRSGIREIRVISDFQLGAVEAVHLDPVPDDVGVRLHRIVVESGEGIPARSIRHGASTTEIRVAVDGEGTRATWIRRVAGSEGAEGDEAGGADDGLDAGADGEGEAGSDDELETGSDDEGEAGSDGVLDAGSDDEGHLLILHTGPQAQAVAALRGALEVEAFPVPDPARPLAVLFPGVADGGRVLAESRPPDEPWMGDVILRLARDEELARIVARSAEWGEVGVWGNAVWQGEELAEAFVPVVRDRAGHPVVHAARAEVGGASRLLLATTLEPGSVEAVALLSALLRAADPTPPLYELEPEVVGDDVLEAWQRAGTPVPVTAAGGDGEGSDGRWLWALVLGLLVVEWVVRRRERATAV